MVDEEYSGERPRHGNIGESPREGDFMAFFTDYEKPRITKNGNISEITFSDAGWTCSLDDSSSSGHGTDDHSSDSSSYG